MVSAAGTGYFFNTKRNRLKDKLVIRKHDPFGKTIQMTYSTVVVIPVIVLEAELKTIHSNICVEEL